MTAGKKLILVRHAKSNHDEWIKSDSERNLNERGHIEAAESARLLFSQILCPDLFISSPAIRALTTAYIFAREGRYPKENIQIRPEVYLSGVQAHLYLIEELSEDLESVMVFGHNPVFYELACFLSGTDIRRFPTSGVLVLESVFSAWKKFEAGSCRTTIRLFRNDIE